MIGKSVTIIVDAVIALEWTVVPLIIVGRGAASEIKRKIYFSVCIVIDAVAALRNRRRKRLDMEINGLEFSGIVGIRALRCYGKCSDSELACAYCPEGKLYWLLLVKAAGCRRCFCFSIDGPELLVINSEFYIGWKRRIHISS